MSLEAVYNPSNIEDKWYRYWLENGYFHSEPDERQPYTIVIPPPNVTGVLHMGHMLNNTVQDILIRRARQEGKNACWVPGTDHASIATEAKVVGMLRERNIFKRDLTREQFLEYAWEWKEKYGGIILEQLKKLGASCDWDRTRFTMEPHMSEAVIDVFVDLFQKGLIYKGKRMVNWDPIGKTALSDEEVIHREVNSKLYHIKYKLSDSDDFLVIATTRPETLLGDTAVCVNPKDERYTHLKGKQVIVPLVNRVVDVIFDEYVEMDFGTGCLKVTPAHDMNDYELGKKHNLETIDIFNEDGTVSPEGILYVGEDRFAARKKIVVDLEEAGLLNKVEDIKNKIGYSERTNAVVEPRLSLQWFIRMSDFLNKNPEVLEAVMSDEIRIIPPKFKNTYRHWLENIKDWCISRQLWWGQRIPAFYEPGGQYVVAKTATEALGLFKALDSRFETLTEKELKQDEDVLDTWFSSWLWPISVFDGFRDSDNKDIAYYYPTDTLVTAPEILFFWVARMIMAGYEYRQEKPFKNVYLTGIVRDKQGRKMSKSLGNSPDPLDLIDIYGADGVRFGMLASSPAGGDLLFDEKQCEQGRNFCNKLWNALKLIKGWQIVDTEQPAHNSYASLWFGNKLNETLAEINKLIEQFRLSDALMMLYNFIWDDYCAWYLEMIKPPYGQPTDSKTYNEAIAFFEKICTILHPFMPFVTEEIWHHIADRQKGNDCFNSLSVTVSVFDENILKQTDLIKSIITGIREVRNKSRLSPKEALHIQVLDTDQLRAILNNEGLSGLLKKLAILDSMEWTKSTPSENHSSFIIGTDQIFVMLNIEVDAGSEKIRLEKELEYAMGFVTSVRKKLENEKFVSSAPAAVVDSERKKLADGEQRIVNLRESIAKL